MKAFKILTVSFLSVLFTSCLSFSISSEIYLEPDKINDFVSDIELRGKIQSYNWKTDFNEYDIYLSSFTSIGTRLKTMVFPFLRAFKTTGNVIYNRQKNDVKFTYICPPREDPLFHTSDEYVEFTNIKIIQKRKNIKFLYSDDFYEPGWAFSLNATYVTGNQLPVAFTKFSIDGKEYRLLMTITGKNNKSTLRSMIKHYNQKFLITDTNGNVVADFYSDEYRVYAQNEVSPDDLVYVIGVYSGLFRLLNRYWYET